MPQVQIVVEVLETAPNFRDIPDKKYSLGRAIQEGIIDGEPHALKWLFDNVIDIKVQEPAHANGSV